MSNQTFTIETIDGRKQRVYQYTDVTRHPVIAVLNRDLVIAATESDKKAEAALDRFCAQMEWATDNLEYVPTSEEAEEVEEVELTDEQIDAIDALQDAWIESQQPKVELAKMSQNALSWVRQQMAFVNSWQLLEAHMNNIWASPAGDRALVEMLEDAERVEPSMLRGMATALRDKMFELLSQYDELSHEQGADLKGKRPADIYRGFYKPMEWLSEKFPFIRPALRHLLEEQSLPYSELDNPDWVDAYTGDLDPEAAEFRFQVKEPTQGTPEEVEALKASEGFNSEDGEDIEEWDDQRSDDIEKDFTGQAEVQRSDDYFDLIHYFPPEIGADGKPVSPIGEPVLDKKTKEIKTIFPHRATSIANDTQVLRQQLGSVRASFRFAPLTDDERDQKVFDALKKKPIFKKVWNKLRDMAASDVPPADLANIIAPFWSDDCFGDVALEYIKLIPAKAGCSNMKDWMDLYGDEVIENMIDASANHDETTQEEIDKYCEKTLELFVNKNVDESVNPATGKADVTRSSIFLEAFFRSAFDAREMSTRDAKGQTHNTAVEAGWTAWRMSKSIKGDNAYRQALAQGRTPKEAMRAFWAVVNAENGTTQYTRKQDVVVSIAGDKTGLVLQSGRKISWRIAMMKQQGNEFSWAGDARQRLANALTRMRIGLEFANLLA